MSLCDKRLWCCIAGLLLPALCPAAGTDVALKAVINRREVFLGESFLMEVQISGATDAPDPDLSAITNAVINLTGSAPQNRSFTSIINGRVHSERFLGRIYYYEITPAAAGTFKAGPISATVNGRRLTHPGDVVTVHGVEDQDIVRLSVEASRTAVLVDEPFTITMVIAIQALKGQFSQYEPLDPRSPPHLDAEYLESKPVPGLDTPNMQQALQGVLVAGNSPGFTLNQYTRQRDIFSMPFMNMGDPFREAARFRFQHQIVTTNNAAFHEYRLALTYTPRKEGVYTFGPVTFKGNAMISVRTSSQPLPRQFFAVGPAAIVRVMPPPEDGRPPTFIGAVGSNLTAEATLDAQTCNIGDPLTMTLRVAGDANLENVFPLDLATVPDLPKRFRIIEGVQTQTKDRERLFTYTLRPIVAGTIELPPIPVSYYDVRARAYRTVHTQPLPVRVNEAALLSEDRVLLTVSDPSADAGLAGAKSLLAVAPFDVHPSGAHSTAPWFPRWALMTLVLAPLLFAASLAVRPAATALQRLKSLGSRATALSQAVAVMDDASSEKNDRAAAALVCRTVRRYCATRFGIATAETMTSSELSEALTVKGVTPAHAAKLALLLDKGASLMFGGTTPSERKGAAWREQILDALKAIDGRRS